MVLSKQWKFLWMFVPKLVYDDSYQNIEYARFSRFVDRSLFLHEAPFIKTLDFKLGKTCGAEDIRVWIRAAEKCSVRELIIEFGSSSSASPAILPRSLYTGCRMLVTLKLSDVVLVDDATCLISFPSLQTLSLLFVKYPSNEFVNRFLSSCPVLEKIDVEQCPDDNVTIFTVRVPSVKRLFMCKSPDKHRDNSDGFVIDAPSLEWLELLDFTGGFCIIENEMPNIAVADVVVTHSHPGKILSSITSIKRLYLCLSTAKDAYPVGSVFPNLVNLTLCRCEVQWLNLLMRLLGDSPKLRALKLGQYHGFQAHQPSPCWIELSSVPECLSSSLEFLKFVDYEGTEEEKELVGFILRNGSCLKKVTISSNSTDPNKKLEMIKELTLSFRLSPTCQLAFN